MKIQASFVQDGKWWVAWTDDVPGALTQGATLDEARENLIDAVRMMRQPVDLSKLPRNKIVIEQLEVQVKRRELIRHLERFGCTLAEEGSRHSKYVNLADPRRVTTVPRHIEIADLLARKICRQLGIPDPKQLKPAYVVDSMEREVLETSRFPHRLLGLQNTPLMVSASNKWTFELLNSPCAAVTF